MNNKSFYLILFFSFAATFSWAQNPSAIVEFESTDKGMLIPRLADTTAVTSPATGLLIYDLSSDAFQYYDGIRWKKIEQGTGSSVWSQSMDTIYYPAGNVGIGISSPLGELHVSNPAEWLGVTFSGTGLDDIAVDQAGYNGTGTTQYIAEVTNAGPNPNLFKWSNDNGATWSADINMATSGIDLGYGVTIGFGALFGHTFGDQWSWSVSESYPNGLIVRDGNVGIGTDMPNAKLDVTEDALIHGLTVGRGGGSVTTNTALGNSALESNTTGDANIAIGTGALYSNTSRSGLVAIGDSSLYHNGIGASFFNTFHAKANTAIGSQSLYSNTTGYRNTANGSQALYSNTTGSYNTANGRDALYSNTTAWSNTATGAISLFSNSTGANNTANGVGALYSNTTGNNNTALGTSALTANTTGNSNVAIGTRALYSNTDRSGSVAIGDSTLYHNGVGAVGSLHATANTAVGYKTLYSNTTGFHNTANGYNALYSNTTGYRNTANGYNALNSNTAGYGNTANGYNALISNTTGYYNTANGYNALNSNTTGYHNTANGLGALFSNTTGVQNIAFGYEALFSNTTGQWNTALGNYANFLDNYYNSTAIGYNAQPGGSNEIRLGNSSVTEIGGYEPWTNVSDARFKTAIQPNVPGLDFINLLNPVTYNMDMDAIATFHNTPDSLRLFDAEREKAEIRYTGFLAQEVEQAALSIGYDFSGVDKPANENDNYGLRYAEFVVPLVKAVQQLSDENEKITETNDKLFDENKMLRAELKALKDDFQKQLIEQNGLLTKRLEALEKK